MRRLRISAISFLNTAPLMWDFEHGAANDESNGGANEHPLDGDFEISYTVPSACADALRAGEADIGIIPAAEYARIPGLVILPDIAIAARGPVRSILLVSKKPLEEIRTVAADTNSRTTIALAKLLFRKWWGGDREFVPMAPDLDRMLAACDAAVIIGDAALLVDRTRYATYDLAEEWLRLTGKPFVFAVWAVRMAALGEMRKGLDLGAVFRDSRDHGLQPAALQQIATEWSRRLGLSDESIVSYLKDNIYYSLDEHTIPGLQLFFDLCSEHGLLPQAPALRFLGALKLLATVPR
jgi:chorismate dehydratase